jgi:Protein of unknown function (DUF2786)
MVTIHSEGDTGTAHPMFAKIRLLLAKAEAEGVTPQERDALNAKAAELAAKHGINIAMAASSRPGSDELMIKEFEIDGDFREEQATLMYYVLEGHGSKCVLTGAGVSAVGHESDIERGELLLTSLLLQMHSSVLNECPGTSVTARAAWMVGFAQAIKDRLAAAALKARMEAEGEHGSSHVALVLQSREVAVKAAFAEEFPAATRGRGRRADMGGYRAGQRATMGGSSVSKAARGALAG